MRNEIWKDIPGFEGYYQVSTEGRVKRLPRKIKGVSRFKHEQIDRHLTERILKPQQDSVGYVHYRLRRPGGNVQLWKGHQLVGLTFLGYDRNNKEHLVLDHLNMIKTDNRLCNLQIVTQQQNKLRYFKTQKGQQTRNKMRGPRGSYKKCSQRPGCRVM